MPELRSSKATDRPTSRAEGDYSIRILGAISFYLQDHGLAKELERIEQTTGLTANDFAEGTRWISAAQFEAVLHIVREVAGTDERFMDVCAYRAAEGYGPLKYITWTTTPEFLYSTAERFGHVLSRVGRFKTAARGPNWIELRYTSERKESRLVCLSRQAQSLAMPTLWGLPPALVREGKCIARGDDCCEYTFTWFQKRRLSLALLGGLIGAGAASAVVAYGIPAPILAASLPLTGGLLAHLYELTRVQRSNEATQREATRALQELVLEESDVRRELLELSKRQGEWANQVEVSSRERREALQRVADTLAQEAKRETHLRTFSHDPEIPCRVSLRTSNI